MERDSRSMRPQRVPAVNAERNSRSMLGKPVFVRYHHLVIAEVANGAALVAGLCHINVLG